MVKVKYWLKKHQACDHLTFYLYPATDQQQCVVADLFDSFLLGITVFKKKQKKNN